MKLIFTLILTGFVSLISKAETIPPNENCGKVLNLNGVLDHVKMNSIADSLLEDYKFTVEFWMKTTALSGNIFTVSTSTEFVDVEIYIKMHDGKVGTSETFTSIFTESTNAVNDNLWHHVAMTHDGDLARLYVDGEYMGAEDYNFFFRSNSKVTLGMTQLGGDKEFFEGQLDELKIWETVRTEEEIIAGLNEKLVGDEADLLAYFDFDGVNNEASILNNSPHEFNFNITSEDIANTRQNPDGSAPTKINNILITNPTCYGTSDGVIDVEVFTEAPSLQYALNNESEYNSDSLYSDLSDGLYKVFIKDSEGCYDSANVTLNDGGDFSASIEFNDEFSFFDAETSPSVSGGTYQWVNCDTDEVFSESSMTRYYPTETANYKVICFKNETCFRESECLPFGDVSVADFDLTDKVEVYPNPTTNQVNVILNDEIMNAKITVFSVTGMKIQELNLFNQTNISIDLSTQENGVYYVQVAKNNSTGVFKVVKQ